jgi:hypothetical protein
MVIATWKTSGYDYLELKRTDVGYAYTGNGCGGTLPTSILSDNDAIAYMERPWSNLGAGPVTVLKTDRPSLKRIL